ncbi:MAG: WecB/TagA/CpsF family glycosyltransferase [candidate division WOR-3 bacterium]
MKYFYFGGIKIDNLNISEAVGKIREILKNEEKGYVVTPNADHIVKLQRDKEFKRAYESAFLVLPDGISLLVASKLLGTPLKGRCAGADLIERIFDIANDLGKSIFILGGTKGSEKIAMEKIKSFFPNVKVAAYSPPFGFEKNPKETSEIINKINSLKTDILIVCVGAPKSEKWLYNNFDKLNIKIAFSLGAALDYFAGTIKRAPKWMQKIGLEWFWRLIQEPKRLWKRYLIGNTIFVFLVLRELIRKILDKRDDQGNF